jgi:hypothetical protein
VLTTKAETTTTEQTNTSDLARVSSSGQDTSVNTQATPVATAPLGTSQQGEIASAALSIPNATLLPVARSTANAPAKAVATAGTARTA